MLPFFFYGTLLDPDVRRAVFPHCAGALSVERAEVTGFQRVRAVAGGYPLLRRVNGARLGGLLVTGMDRAAVLAMVHFEGAEYLPQRVRARTADGRRRTAWCFLAPHRRIASRERWELRRWQLRDKAVTMRRIDRWMLEYGVAEMQSHDMTNRMRRWIREHAATA